MFSLDETQFGSENVFHAIQVGSTGNVELTSQLVGVAGSIAVQSGGDVSFSSEEIFGGCAITPILLSADLVFKIVEYAGKRRVHCGVGNLRFKTVF